MSVYHTGDVSAPRAATSVGAVARRSLAQRMPWLWHDYVASRVPLPLWVLSALFFAVLYAINLLPAIIAGELPQFVRDVRYLLLVPLPAFGSFAIGYMPGAINRLWNRLRPWLGNTEEQIAALEAATPDLLGRFFWLGALIMAIITVPYTIPGGDPWARDYVHPGIIEKASLLTAPFVIYFGGAVQYRHCRPRQVRIRAESRGAFQTRLHSARREGHPPTL